jgi:hypothetical protein
VFFFFFFFFFFVGGGGVCVCGLATQVWKAVLDGEMRIKAAARVRFEEDLGVTTEQLMSGLLPLVKDVAVRTTRLLFFLLACSPIYHACNAHLRTPNPRHHSSCTRPRYVIALGSPRLVVFDDFAPRVASLPHMRPPPTHASPSHTCVPLPHMRRRHTRTISVCLPAPPVVLSRAVQISPVFKPTDNFRSVARLLPSPNPRAVLTLRLLKRGAVATRERVLCRGRRARRVWGTTLWSKFGVWERSYWKYV